MKPIDVAAAGLARELAVAADRVTVTNERATMLLANKRYGRRGN